MTQPAQKPLASASPPRIQSTHMKTKNAYHYYVPTRVLFGTGILNDLHKQALPGKKALLVLGNGSSAKLHGYLALCEQRCRMTGVDWVLFVE